MHAIVGPRGGWLALWGKPGIISLLHVSCSLITAMKHAHALRAPVVLARKPHAQKAKQPTWAWWPTPRGVLGQAPLSRTPLLACSLSEPISQKLLMAPSHHYLPAPSQSPSHKCC